MSMFLIINPIFLVFRLQPKAAKALNYVTNCVFLCFDETSRDQLRMRPTATDTRGAILSLLALNVIIYFVLQY